MNFGDLLEAECARTQQGNAVGVLTRCDACISAPYLVIPGSEDTAARGSHEHAHAYPQS